MDCLNEFQVRFQNSSLFQLVRLGRDSEFDPTPLFRGLDKRRTHIEGLQRLYRDQLTQLPQLRT
jgi:hypothetical protein